jgi:pyruvate-ferredoxin/flavodoxin oxidoreductase
MAKAVFDKLIKPAKNSFTAGIDDDVSHKSLPPELGFTIDPAKQGRAVFYGLCEGGADGNRA